VTIQHYSAALTTTPGKVWQTSSGVSPDPAIDNVTVFQAGVPTDPKGIEVFLPATPAIYLCNPGDATYSDGIPLPASTTLPYNVIGNEQLWLGSASDVTVLFSVTGQ
jgi:hypothetical protein